MITTLSRRKLPSGLELVLFDDSEKKLSADSLPNLLGAVIGDGFVTFFNPPTVIVDNPASPHRDDEAVVGFGRPAGLWPVHRDAMARRAFEGLGLDSATHPEVYFLRLQDSEYGPLDVDTYVLSKAVELEDEQYCASFTHMWGNPPIGLHPATSRDDFSWKGLHAVADALSLQFPSTKLGANITGNVVHTGDLTVFAYRSKLFGSLALPVDAKGPGFRSVEFESFDTLRDLTKVSERSKDNGGRTRFAAQKGRLTQAVNPEKARSIEGQAKKAADFARARVQALAPFASNRPAFVEMMDWLTEGHGEAFKRIQTYPLSIATHKALMKLAILADAIAEVLVGPEGAPGANGLSGVIATSAPPEFAAFAFGVGYAARKCRDLVIDNSTREIGIQEKNASRPLRLRIR